MPEHLHKRKHLTSFQLIILGFEGVILYLFHLQVEL